jgi:hypothetical protein
VDVGDDGEAAHRRSYPYTPIGARPANVRLEVST